MDCLSTAGSIATDELMPLIVMQMQARDEEAS
jgi:hypothetical protein